MNKIVFLLVIALLLSGCVGTTERTYIYTDPQTKFDYKLVLSGNSAFVLYSSDGVYSGKYEEDSSTVTILPEYFPGRAFKKVGNNLSMMNANNETMVLQ